MWTHQDLKTCRRADELNKLTGIHNIWKKDETSTLYIGVDM